MDIKYFEHLCARALTVVKSAGSGWKLEVFRHHKRAWHPTPPTSLTFKDFEQVKRSEKPTRLGHQHLIYDKRLDAIFALTAPKRTRQIKVDEIQKSVQESLLAGEHEFDAHHDKLTHLLNRSGFLKEAKRILKKHPKQDLNDSSSMASSGAGIGFVSLDIDHFKQVNDSYGHQYGDAVLVAFAWRISDHLASLNNNGKYEAIIGRPGGEEFEILIGNLNGEDEAYDIAESFRKAIHDDPIPSDKQWPTIFQDQDLETSLLPTNQNERQISASIGYTYRQNTSANTKIEQIYSSLRAEADAAVYRAKADGRNCVRNYSQIAKEHGRILEHFRDAGVVAIDIGKSVGVEHGQVFDVYLPSFAGGSPYLQISDRGSKTLGSFPRVPAGRIQIFDAQKDISFCQILASRIPGDFPASSRLCYVPHGINTPLVREPHLQDVLQSIPTSDLPKVLDTLLLAEELSALCLFFIEKGSSDKKLGQEGNLLSGGHLYAFLRAALPSGTLFSLIDESTVAALITTPVTQNQLQEFAFRCSDLVAEQSNHWIAAGIVGTDSMKALVREALDEEDPSAASSPLPIPIDGAKLFYLARVSLFVAKRPHVPTASDLVVLEIFNNRTPASAVSMWRRLRKYDEAIEDYFQFREIGFHDALLNNQGGLALFESRDDKAAGAAVNALRNSLAKAPSTLEPLIRANLALALAKANKYDEAYIMFKQSRDYLRTNKTLSWVYDLHHAKSALEAHRVNRASIAKQTLLRLIDKALKSARPTKKRHLNWCQELKQVRDSGQIK